jgi:hypothetical protein
VTCDPQKQCFGTGIQFSSSAPLLNYEISTSWFGVKADYLGVKTNNQPIFQKVINMVPSGTQRHVVIQPSGGDFYYLGDSLLFHNKSFTFECTSFLGAKFMLPVSKVGFYIDRANPGSADHGTYRNFQLFAEGKNSTDTTYHTAGSMRYNAVVMKSVNYLENFYIRDFSGDGLHLFGWISVDFSDVSGSAITNYRVQQCGNGYYVGMADASGINFYDPNVADCAGFAIVSESFYGNKYSGGLFHNNASGIYYNPTQAFCNDIFLGTYFEPSQPDGVGVGYITHIGGWPGTTFSGVYHFNRMNGDANENVYVYKVGGSGNEKVGFGRSPSNSLPQILRQTADNDKFYEQNTGSSRSIYTNNWVEKYSLLNPDTPLFHRIGWDAKIDNSLVTRGFRTPMMGFGNYWIEGGHINQWGSDTLSSGLISAPYFPGDKIWNSNYTSGGTIFWICYRRGSVSINRDYLTDVYVTNPNGTDTLYVDGYTDRIQEGDYIHVNGVDRYVLWKSNNETKLKISSSTSVFTSIQRVTYNPPLWLAISGTGGGGGGSDTISAGPHEVVFGNSAGTNVTSAPNLKNDSTQVTIQSNNSNNPGGFNDLLNLRGNAPSYKIWDNTGNSGYIFRYDRTSPGILSFDYLTGTYPGSILNTPLRLYGTSGRIGLLYGFNTTDGYGSASTLQSSLNFFTGTAVKPDDASSQLTRSASDMGAYTLFHNNNGSILCTGISIVQLRQ